MNKATIGSALLIAAGILTAAPGICAAAAPSTNAPAAKPADKPIDLFDSVIAKGKGLEVKRSQLDDAMVNVRVSAAAHGRNLTPDESATIERQVLQRLIQVQLLVARATDADKASGQQAATLRFDALRTNSTSPEAFTRQLKAMGTTAEELRRKMVQESTAEAVLERDLSISVKDDAVKKFYDDNPSKFEQPEMVRASHILLKTRDDSGAELSDDKKAEKHKLAEELLKRARAGEDFAKLAEQYSEDPGSKDRGGEYTFPRGQMVPEFEAAAFSLKTNEVSDIVTTQFGYHIIKLLEKIPAHKIEFAKVENNIKEYLKQQQIKDRQAEVQSYLEKLQKDADVAILDEHLKPQEPPLGTLPAGHPPVPPASKPEKN
jgi:peptidyl-prolyl cis-trans isomerase C